jgi:hypothetical protein
MNPTQDAAHRVHQVQAKRRGQPPMAYAQFCARLPNTYETDLTGLLMSAARPSVSAMPAGKAKVKLGEVYLTPNAAGTLPRDEVLRAVDRHAAGDWGQLDEHDRRENERALETRGRLLSVYEASNGRRFYVLTESGWGQTTVLLPEDY